MDVELTDQLGYEPGGAPPGNSRKGTRAKTLHAEHRSVRSERPA